MSTAGQAAVSLTKNQQMLDTTMDTLRILADETDGRAILNSNDLDRGLRQIVRDSSAYYLLGYTSAVTTDGKFHKINVRVKRPGLQVRARPGYLAMSAVEAERALAPKKAGTAPGHHRGAGNARRHRAAAAQSDSKLDRHVPGRRWEDEDQLRVESDAGGAGCAPRGRGDACRCSPEARTRICTIASKALAPGRVEFEVPPGPDRARDRRRRMRPGKCSIARRERSSSPASVSE